MVLLERGLATGAQGIGPSESQAPWLARKRSAREGKRVKSLASNRFLRRRTFMLMGFLSDPGTLRVREISGDAGEISGVRTKPLTEALLLGKSERSPPVVSEESAWRGTLRGREERTDS